MRRLLIILVILMLFLPLAVQGGVVLGAGGGDGGSTSSGGGGGGTKRLQLETFIRDLEKWQTEKPERFDYLKTILYKVPFTTSEYKLPAVWVYYDSDNTTVTRTQEVPIWAYVRNDNPIEIRRVLYLYLEALEPGESDFKQLNALPQIVQTNEYGENTNGTVRTFPDFTSFKDLKAAGQVTLRIKASDGQITWYSSNMSWEKPPHYDELTLTVENNPPVLADVSMVGPDPPRYKDPIEYVVNVDDPDGDMVNVTLHILDDRDKERWNETQLVKSGRVSFLSSEYGFFGERDAGKNFSYYYSYGDGLSSNVTSVFDGPHIKPSPKIWVENPRVVPEDENCYWWQNYVFSLDVRNQNPYEYDLAVTLFTDTRSHPQKRYGTRTVRVGQEPQTVYFEAAPFDVSDTDESFAYRFEYSEYDQFGKDYVEGSGPRPINQKIVKYGLVSLPVTLNILMILLTSLFFGIVIERRFCR